MKIFRAILISSLVTVVNANNGCTREQAINSLFGPSTTARVSELLMHALQNVTTELRNELSTIDTKSIAHIIVDDVKFILKLLPKDLLN
ncbi:hypothetical protein LPJ59_006734, partial [Coemansia sp. RSA 2399]